MSSCQAWHPPNSSGNSLVRLGGLVMVELWTVPGYGVITGRDDFDDAEHRKGLALAQWFV